MGKIHETGNGKGAESEEPGGQDQGVRSKKVKRC